MALYINGQEVSGGSGASSLEDLTDVTIDPETLTGGQTIVYDDTNDEWVNGEGGGKHWEGTYSEYLSLETKDPDTVYFITDISDSNDRFQPVVYSLEEREIGVWIDGKPLYEISLPFDTVSSATSDVDTSTLSIETLISYNFSATGNTYYYSGSDFVRGYFTDATNSTFRVVSGSSYPRCTGYVTIRYTKTTDVAGSGQWTPQGVPAVHYSTDEQVIGTWLDGSTLYEKTFNPTNLNLPDQTWTSDVLGTSGIVITNWEGYLKFSGLTALFPLTYYRHSNEYVTITTNDTCSDLNIRPNASGLTVDSLMITIRYTKTPA